MASDLQRKGYLGKTIGIKLRYDDFRIATRDQTIDHVTADPRTIRNVAGQCLKRVQLDRRLRLLGVRRRWDVGSGRGGLWRGGRVARDASLVGRARPVATEVSTLEAPPPSCH